MGAKKDTGYRRMGQVLSKDSADKIKSAVRAIGNDLFIPFQYRGSNAVTIQYRLLSPAKTNQKDLYPLVLVLHGSGAIGTDNAGQMGITATFWAQPGIREKYPAYIVAPQFPRRSSNYSPDPEKKVLASTPDPCLTTVLELIDSLKKVLPVDAARIYVMGFSMGGSGAINSLELRPDLFAAALSISGIPAFNHMKTLAQRPLWLVHGNADHENPMAGDSLLYRELRSMHGRQIRFWEVDGLGHDIYSPLYTSDLAPAWLFRHKAKRVTLHNNETP